MRTHDQVVKKLMKRPGVRAEIERLEREESELLDALLKARQDAGLTQAQVDARHRALAVRGGEDLIRFCIGDHDDYERVVRRS